MANSNYQIKRYTKANHDKLVNEIRRVFGAHQRMGDGFRNGILVGEGLAGPGIASFRLFQTPDVSKAALEAVVAQIRRERDVVEMIACEVPESVMEEALAKRIRRWMISRDNPLEGEDWHATAIAETAVDLLDLPQQWLDQETHWIWGAAADAEEIIEQQEHDEATEASGLAL